MKLSAAQREIIKQKYGGLCAYCGEKLSDKWHADHLLPVIREAKWISGVGAVPTGKVKRPENNALENMMPACAPCNIDKNQMTIEQWRKKLQDAPNVLDRNSPTYRHAKRFGLILETTANVVFYFETIAQAK